MSTITENAALIVASVIAGWWVRGWIDTILVRLGVRILASDIGKRKVLETLKRGIEKL